MNNNTPDLFEQLVRLEWLLHRYHQQNHRYRGPMGDPHRGQGRILALLRLKPEISQKELSNILDIRSQSLGELLAKLERSGYITRTPSEADRRVMEIRLTEAGREASDKNGQEPDAEGLFGCLNEDEQAMLSDYLNRIILALEQRFGGTEPGPDFRGHPHFHGMGCGRQHGTEGGHPPFDRRDFCRYPHMGRHRPPFDGRGFGRHHAEGYDPEDINEE